MTESNTKKIQAILILEIIGRPAEHLTETLEKIIKEMGKEKGVEVVGKKINEPVELKEQKDLFTTFAEVEIEVEEIISLTMLMFKYMPAHVEVVSPEFIALTNNSWTDILTELTRRLHKYDEVARVMQMQLAQMQQKLNSTVSEKTTEPEKKKVKKKVSKKK